MNPEEWGFPGNGFRRKVIPRKQIQREGISRKQILKGSDSEGKIFAEVIPLKT